jgi:hypothetical protein
MLGGGEAQEGIGFIKFIEFFEFVGFKETDGDSPFDILF